MDRNLRVINKKRVVILGGGMSGVGAAILASQKGHDVFLSDGGDLKDAFAKALKHKNIPHETGGHDLNQILNADLVVKSPGIPDTAQVIKKIQEAGISIVSEIEFAASFSEDTIIAITGSNGKTTVTSLLGHIVQSALLNTTVGGNIGQSFAAQVAEGTAEYRVLEVSSFQLDGIVDFKPHIAMLLNITPDHLDRYDHNFKNYIESKMRIVMNQDNSDYFIYNLDDKAITNAMKSKEINACKVPFSLVKELEFGSFLKDDNIHIQLENYSFTMPIQNLSIKGQHNTANAMAAATAATLLQIRKETIRQSLESFQGVEHRLERVLKINRVQYINDSKATNVNATYYALDSMEKPTIWIVGGVDKGNEYKDLFHLVNKNVKAIVCLGIDNSKLVNTFSNCVGKMVQTTNMEDAVRIAYKLAEPGDNVLLSPACASFDLFDNYEDRGRRFKNAVRSL